jgi:hypothetical protein
MKGKQHFLPQIKRKSNSNHPLRILKKPNVDEKRSSSIKCLSNDGASSRKKIRGENNII